MRAQTAGRGLSLGSPASLDFESPGFWRLAWRRLRRNRVAMVSLGVLLVLLVVAVLAPLVAPYDPSEQHLRDTFAEPGFDHLMGTDNLGRDWFSRIVYGARLSLTVGLLAQAVVIGIGVPVGLAAGYFGRRADSVLMRLTDIGYAFPDLLLIILLRSVMGGSVITLFLIIGFVGWMDMARLLRGQVLSLKEREFVGAARSLGATDREIMLRHILPNAMGPLIVLVAFGIPRAVFAEAALSFIGFGVNPSIPSWGTMVQEGYSAIFAHPHLVLFPSMAIAVLMLSFTFLGDGLRDALDPRVDHAPARPRKPKREEAPAPPRLPVETEPEPERRAA